MTEEHSTNYLMIGSIYTIIFILGVVAGAWVRAA